MFCVLQWWGLAATAVEEQQRWHRVGIAYVASLCVSFDDVDAMNHNTEVSVGKSKKNNASIRGETSGCDGKEIGV